MSELNGGTGENENRLRLDRMNDVIQSMIALTLEQGKMNDRRHEQVMEEIQDLITLQREHRIDIMALFEGTEVSAKPLKSISSATPRRNFEADRDLSGSTLSSWLG